LVSLVLVFGVHFLLLCFGRSRWLQDNFAGSAVRKAEAALAEVASFEKE
jgi:hypothetical protein